MIDVIAGALRISTPYTLAAMGGVTSERSGTINIALEGALLVSALGFAVATEKTGSPWIGVVAALMSGVALMAVHAFLCVNLRANHIISGVGLNLFAAGLSKFVLKATYGSSSNGPRVGGFEETWWSGVQHIPLLGEIAATPMVLLAAMLVPLLHLGLLRTRFGLRLRAVGEHPQAAESQGVNVKRIRWGAVVISGAFTALGGAYLAADQHQFTQGMSAGRGFIAMSAVVFGQWKPWRVWLGCLLFGLAEAGQIQLQSAQSGIPSQLVQMVPYVLTLAVLASSGRDARAPAALGRPFPEGTR